VLGQWRLGGLGSHIGTHIYVSHVDIFWFYVTKSGPRTKGSYRNVPFSVEPWRRSQ
jgi:hypothetical protein